VLRIIAPGRERHRACASDSWFEQLKILEHLGAQSAIVLGVFDHEQRGSERRAAGSSACHPHGMDPCQNEMGEPDLAAARAELRRPERLPRCPFSRVEGQLSRIVERARQHDRQGMDTGSSLLLRPGAGGLMPAPAHYRAVPVFSAHRRRLVSIIICARSRCALAGPRALHKARPEMLARPSV